MSKSQIKRFKANKEQQVSYLLSHFCCLPELQKGFPLNQQGAPKQRAGADSRYPELLKGILRE